MRSANKTCRSLGVLQGHAFRSVALSAALLLGACAQNGGPNLSLTSEAPKSVDIATASTGDASVAELQKATAYWGEEYSKNPRNAKAALSYAQNLKALGNKPQALTVLQSAYQIAPEDTDIASEYGRLALELGQVSTAGQLLARADNPAKPDWKIISARGTVLAKQGRYKEAIAFYERAQALAPEQASVLNNLAMAHTMNGEAARGEQLLRQAKQIGSSDPKIEKNLALVMDLQGKAQAEPAKFTTEATPAGKVAAVTTHSLPPAATPQARARSTAKTASGSPDWNKPLPIETEAPPARPAPSTSSAIDPDQVIRAAMAAESAKAIRR
jgi:Flp pilus assembly protein TadD